MKDELEKNRLHELLQGLSKSDKAYLKKYSKIFNTKGDTKHKIYYSIVDAMKEYSFEVLKRKLEKHGGYRRFKNAENELYHQILEDLVLLKSKKRPTWQYYIEHMKLGYLFLGGKYDEALKQFDILDKLKDESKNVTIDYLYHKFHYHHLASINVSRRASEFQKLKEKEQMLRQSVEDVKLEFLLEAAIFNFENYRLSSFNKTKSEFIHGLKSFENEYVVQLPTHLETDKWKMLSVYYFFFCHYFLTIDNQAQLNVYSMRFYETLKGKEVKGHFSHEYANAVHFRIQYLILTRNKEAYELIEEFKIFTRRDDFFESKSFFYVMYCQLALLVYNKFNDIENLQIFVEEEREGVKEVLSYSSHPVGLATNLQWAIAFVKLKQFKEAQVYLDTIFDKLGKIKEASNGILIAARVLDILIHFELKNYENIKYYIDNLEKEMERNNQLLSFDKQVFKYLRRLNQQFYARQEVEKEEFLAFLRENSNEDRMESHILFLDLEDWLLGLEV